MFFNAFSSPGVIKTNVHKRGGMTDEQYEKVTNYAFMQTFIQKLFFFSFLNIVKILMLWEDMVRCTKLQKQYRSLQAMMPLSLLANCCVLMVVGEL